MGLIEQAKQDWQDFTTDTDGFGVVYTITAPDTSTLEVTGLHSKHHVGIDIETGNLVNTKNAHISFSEQIAIDAGFTVRNADGEVNLSNYRVSATDSTGLVKEYIIREWFPDETIGVIVCILGDYIP